MTVWQGIGWAGNACMFSRFLVQWIASERASRSVAPASFWILSLCGTACMSTYVTSRGELVLLAGLLVNGFTYLRNLHLKLSRRGLGSSRAAAIAVLALGPVLVAGIAELRIGSDPLAWLACAMVGQSLWSSRFLVQWWHSEKVGKSGFPRAFWWISLSGNTFLLSYAVHLLDPVLIAGFLLGPIVQIRNLMLSRPARVSPLSGPAGSRRFSPTRGHRSAR